MLSIFEPLTNKRCVYLVETHLASVSTTPISPQQPLVQMPWRLDPMVTRDGWAQRGTIVYKTHGDGANYLVKSTLTLSKYFMLRNIVTILSFFIQHVVWNMIIAIELSMKECCWCRHPLCCCCCIKLL
jgi:hypothetical protein